jgi:DNA-binding response OmpR family regulator
MNSTHRILVVDDQEDHLRALQLILDAVGYRTLACDNAQAALHMLEQDPGIKLIIADVAMPQMNGYQLLETVRRHPEWTSIPFVFLTARALDSDIRYGKSLGVDDYLTKPIEPEDLLAVVTGKLLRHEQLEHRAEHQTHAVHEAGLLSVGELRIDHRRHMAWYGDQNLALSVREFALLSALASQAGNVVSSCDLLRISHNLDSQDSSEARELIRPLVRSLRNKIGDAELIETVRGLGYRMSENRGD